MTGSPNTFPAPLGVAQVAFSNLKAGQTTPNFVWNEQGLYTISLELADLNLPGDKVTFQSISGAGTATALVTMLESGYYDFVVPPGGATYNFTTVNNVKNVRMTKRFLGTP